MPDWRGCSDCKLFGTSIRRVPLRSIVRHYQGQLACLLDRGDPCSAGADCSGLTAVSLSRLATGGSSGVGAVERRGDFSIFVRRLLPRLSALLI